MQPGHVRRQRRRGVWGRLPLGPTDQKRGTQYARLTTDADCGGHGTCNKATEACSCESGWEGAACSSVSKSCQSGWALGAIPKLQGAGTDAANARYSLTGTQNGHPHYTNNIDSAYQIYYGLGRWNLYGPAERDYCRTTAGGEVPTSSWSTNGCVSSCAGASPAPMLTWCKPTPI